MRSCANHTLEDWCICLPIMILGCTHINRIDSYQALINWWQAGVQSLRDWVIEAYNHVFLLVFMLEYSDKQKEMCLVFSYICAFVMILFAVMWTILQGQQRIQGHMTRQCCQHLGILGILHSVLISLFPWRLSQELQVRSVQVIDFSLWGIQFLLGKVLGVGGKMKGSMVCWYLEVFDLHALGKSFALWNVCTLEELSSAQK